MKFGTLEAMWAYLWDFIYKLSEIFGWGISDPTEK